MGLITGNILKCLLSGGNWNNNTNAGVWNVNFNNNRSNSNNNVGGRLDYSSPSRPEGWAEWNCRDMVSGVKRTVSALFFLVGLYPKTRGEAV